MKTWLNIIPIGLILYFLVQPQQVGHTHKNEVIKVDSMNLLAEQAINLVNTEIQENIAYKRQYDLAQEKRIDVLENKVQDLKEHPKIIEKVVTLIPDSAYVEVWEYKSKQKGLKLFSKVETDSVLIKKKIKLIKE